MGKHTLDKSSLIIFIISFILWRIETYACYLLLGANWYSALILLTLIGITPIFVFKLYLLAFGLNKK